MNSINTNQNQQIPSPQAISIVARLRKLLEQHAARKAGKRGAK